VAPPERALGRQRDLIDRRNTGLPCTVILNQPGNVLKLKPSLPRNRIKERSMTAQPYLNLIVSAALECAPNEPYRDVSEHPAILFATALPEHLRDHNRDISAVRECGNRRRSSR